MNYVLALENYQGPIDKLLELVQEKKLEITLVSIARVTDEFLAYFEKLKEAEREAEMSGIDAMAHADLKVVLSDFLVIVSRLVLMKSKVLIPDLEVSEEEEEEMKDLEWRLKLYQELKGAGFEIQKIWRADPYSFGREFLMNREVLFFPPGNLSVNDLSARMSILVGELQKFLIPVQNIKRETIQLKKKIEEVFQKVSEGVSRFFDLGGERKSRTDLVVLFLAVLHLIKDQMVHVEQTSDFGEILIAKKDSEGYNNEND